MIDNSIHTAISRAWWALALRGALAILFGIAAFMWPGLTVALFVGIFAGFALLDGVMAVAGGLQSRLWGLTLFGILGIAAGIVTLVWPGITALTLIYVIATWAIFRGVLEISAAITLRKMIPNEWFLILGGVASIIFGALVLAYPGAGALALVWWIAAYAIVIGVLLLTAALRMRGFVRPMSPNAAV